MVDLIHCDDDDDLSRATSHDTNSYQSNIGTLVIVWLAAGRRVMDVLAKLAGHEWYFHTSKLNDKSSFDHHLRK
jgi:hypothetical protein